MENGGEWAIHLSGDLMWNMAAQNAQEVTQSEASAPATLTCIIMSAAAAEALINELPARIMLELMGGEHSRLPPLPEGRTWPGIKDALETMEQENMQILSKYLMASMLLPGDPLDKGRQPYQDFARLIALRNAIVHLKPQEIPVENRIQRVIQYFESRNWTRVYMHPNDAPISRGDLHTPWLMKILSPQIARWACRASAAIIKDITDRFGEPRVPGMFGWQDYREDERVRE